MLDELEKYAFNVAKDLYESTFGIGAEAAERVDNKDENFDLWLSVTLGAFRTLRPRLHELREIIQASRGMHVASEIYKNALWHRRNFILGEFISFDLLPSDDSLSIDEMIGQLREDETLRRVHRKWMSFWRKNNMYRRLNSWFEKTERDGTSYIRLFPGDGDAPPTVRFVDALTIKGDMVEAGQELPDPIRVAGTTPDSLGIVTDNDDIETILGYILSQDLPTNGLARATFVDESEIIQQKIMTDYDTLVGLPRMYAAFTNIRRAEKLLVNSSVLTQIQTAIAMIRKHEVNNGAAVSRFADRNSTGSRQDKVTGKTVRTKRYGPGTILDAKAGTDYDFPAHRLDPSKWTSPMHEELARVAACAMVPVDWLLSKEISEPLNPGSPFLRNFKQERRLYYSTYEELFWRTMSMMGENVDQLQLDYDLCIEGPVIPTAKPLDQARIDDIYVKHSAKSPQQIARENGTRYTVMRAEILAHRETKQDDEQFPGDAGMTNVNNNGTTNSDGESTSDGGTRQSAGDGGDTR